MTLNTGIIARLRLVADVIERLGIDQDRILAAEVVGIAMVESRMRLCVEHGGFAGEKAERWWSQRSRVPMPPTAVEAAELAGLGAIAEPTAIHIRKVPGTRFSEIVGYEIGEPPEFDLESVVAEIDEWGQLVRRVDRDHDSDDEDDEVPF